MSIGAAPQAAPACYSQRGSAADLSRLAAGDVILTPVGRYIAHRMRCDLPGDARWYSCSCVAGRCMSTRPCEADQVMRSRFRSDSAYTVVPWCLRRTRMSSRCGTDGSLHAIRQLSLERRPVATHRVSLMRPRAQATTSAHCRARPALRLSRSRELQESAPTVPAPDDVQLLPHDLDDLTDDALTDAFLLQRRNGHRYSVDDVATAWIALRATGPMGLVCARASTSVAASARCC